MPGKNARRDNVRKSMIRAAQEQARAMEAEITEDARDRLLAHFAEEGCVSGQNSRTGRGRDYHSAGHCIWAVIRELGEDWGEQLTNVDIRKPVEAAYNQLALRWCVYADSDGHVRLTPDQIPEAHKLWEIIGGADIEQELRDLVEEY